MLLAGCSFNPFLVDGFDSASTYDVQIVDARSAVSKKGGRERPLALAYYHGDDMFVPGKLELFRGALAQAYATPPQQITLHRFDVVDIPAKRLRSVQAGAMASVSIPASIAMAPDSAARDFIVCVVEASVDGQMFKGRSAAYYNIRPTDTMIYNQPVYVAAVDRAVTESLSRWVAQATRASRVKTYDSVLVAIHAEAEGAEFRGQYDKAIELLIGGESDLSFEALQPVHDYCMSKYTHDDLAYVAFSSQDQFEQYRSSYEGKKALVWLDMVCPLGYKLLSDLVVETGHVESASEVMSAAIAIAPYWAEGYAQLGYFLNKQNRCEEALEAYEQAVQLSSEFEESRYIKPAALRGLGFTLIELGRLDEAEAALEASLALEPESELAKSELQFIDELRLP